MNHRSLRVAIAGGGMIAGLHRRGALLASAQLVGVLASSPERSQAVADEWGIDRGYASFDDLLADKPDVVHICTPNKMHAPMALAALEAGINLVCEKPLGMSAAGATEMERVAERAGVIATVPFVYRYHPVVREIRSRVQSGELGRMLLLHGSYTQDWMLPRDVASWRVDPADGGASRAFADIGSHWADLIEFVSGEHLAEVSAMTSIAHPQRPSGSAAAFSGGAGGELADVTTEDIALAMFRTSSGVPVQTTVSQVSAGRKNRLWFEVDGSEGAAVFDQEHPEEASIATLNQTAVIVRDPRTNHLDAARLSALPAGHAQGYAYCFEAFIADTYAAIAGHRPEGLPTFADGARAARVVDAVLTSAQQRQWVELA
ncbi:Gfo/Idh/MocA family protein [Aestuariimicrobium ganziense]|uniref:Gfo/Idh/MocA family protein n=1 Tax=Aestuariimicrobium ganziense TaxID=2773677 RepID=UPI00194502A5|nr:Gfo/Idh/MocA family oxidoreductase [Aestuariimicrobium ganziense]